VAWEQVVGTSWVEIDVGAIKNNYFSIRRKIGPQVKLLGVVKANAYGHGIVEIGRVLEMAGVDMLGVTSLAEGKELRRAGITLPILVFGAFLPEEAACFLQDDLTATLAGWEAIEWLKEAVEKGEGQTLKVHLKVETGMGRFGFWPDEVVPAAQRISAIPGLVLEGIYSHLATAMQKNKSFSQSQFKQFQEVCAALEKAGINGLIKHIANSAAIVELPEMHLDMVRAGTLLYGQFSSLITENDLKLQDSWTLKAKIIYMREIPKGQPVGYGRTYQASKPIPVAVLPIGFVDGVQVEPILQPTGLLDLVKGVGKLILRYFGYAKLSTPVFFPGGTGRVIGKVGMQLMMVDVSGVKNLKVGTVASIPAIRTAVGLNLPRVYVEADKIIAVSKSQMERFETVGHDDQLDYINSKLDLSEQLERQRK
jgi:alanine racemase